MLLVAGVHVVPVEDFARVLVRVLGQREQLGVPHHGGLFIRVAQGAVQVQVVPRGAEGGVVERGASPSVGAAARCQLPLYWPAFPASRTSLQLEYIKF